MPNVKISYETVSAKVSELKNAIMSSQSGLEALYTEAMASIEQYSGEEADALRELQDTEKALMLEVCDFLQKFVDSIQFVSNELQELDVTGAAHMQSEPARYKKGGPR